MRYSQLIDIVAKRRPATILEVGTWNGGRALEMLTASPGARYYGFDLFEEATDETDEKELNVKKHFSAEDVVKRLRGHQAILFRGDTNETLRTFSEEYSGPPIDLAHIDGGHSVETIRSDWENVRKVMRPNGVVVFDDYYDVIDIDTFGCNRIVEGLPHEVLPVADPVMQGGTVRMVKVEMAEVESHNLLA